MEGRGDSSDTKSTHRTPLSCVSERVSRPHPEADSIISYRPPLPRSSSFFSERCYMPLCYVYHKSPTAILLLLLPPPWGLFVCPPSVTRRSSGGVGPLPHFRSWKREWDPAAPFPPFNVASRSLPPCLSLSPSHRRPPLPPKSATGSRTSLPPRRPLPLPPFRHPLRVPSEAIKEKGATVEVPFVSTPFHPLPLPDQTLWDFGIPGEAFRIGKCCSS